MNTLKVVKLSTIVILPSYLGKGKIQISQNSDLLSPYILACNYAEGSTKMITMSLNGIHLLLSYDLVLASDIRNILRVLSIQAASGNKLQSDGQLKLLQIVLQMVNIYNSLSTNNPKESSLLCHEFFTESTLGGFLSVCLQLSDAKIVNVSVTSASLGTARQIVALVLDGANSIYYDSIRNLDNDNLVNISPEQASSSFSLSAITLIKEFCLYIQGLSGDWIILRNVSVPQSFALDILFDILNNDQWKKLFMFVPIFRSLLKDFVCPSIRPLLRELQDEYVANSLKVGQTIAAAFASRVVRLARSVIIGFLSLKELLPEIDLLLTLLVHSLQPDRGDWSNSNSNQGAPSPANYNKKQKNLKNASESASSGDNSSSLRSRLEEVTSSILPGGTLMFRLTGIAPSAAPGNKGISSSASSASSAATSSANKTSASNPSSLSALGGFYITLQSNLNPNNSSLQNILGTMAQINGMSSGSSTIPSHPAALCLEALLAFVVSSSMLHLLVYEDGLKLLETVLINTSLSVSLMLTAAIGIESNAR